MEPDSGQDVSITATSSGRPEAHIQSRSNQPTRTAGQRVNHGGPSSAPTAEPRSPPQTPPRPLPSPVPAPTRSPPSSPSRPPPGTPLSLFDSPGVTSFAARPPTVSRNPSPAHSVSSSIASAASSQAGSYVGRSFTYGFYNPGPTRPLPSVRVPDGTSGAHEGGVVVGAGGPILADPFAVGFSLNLVPACEEEVARSEGVGVGGFTQHRKVEFWIADMPLGILNTKDGSAPGTVVAALQDTREKRSNTGLAVAGSMSPEEMLDPRLKYDRSGKEPVLLVPQPTDDPNDPLNWPRWRRDVILVILCFMSVIASTLSPLLAADTFSLFIDFTQDLIGKGDFTTHYTFTNMALLTGYHLLGVGLAGFLFVASARVWGKRHLYLLGCLLIIVSSAWGGATGLNYGSLLAARVVQGIGLAPFEALVNASVADLYFVHERGTRMALSNLALFGGAFFTPIIVGKMSYSIGWQWSFYLVAIFSAVAFPLIFFFVPETAYRRDASPVVATDSLGNPYVEGNVAPAGGAFNEPMNGTTTEPVANGVHKETPTASGVYRKQSIEEVSRPFPQKMSYARSLLPFSGRKTDDSLWKLVLRPFPLFFHPAVAWACLIQGAIIGWTVLIGVVLAALFVGPPLFFGEVQTGYMYAGPFIGALIGFVLSGVIADWSYKILTRWNGGVYEPEFRLVLVIPQLILGCAGLYGFSASASGPSPGSGPQHGWFLPTFCFALEVAGMVMGAVASALYIADAHNEIAVEAFTCLLIFKNVFSFGLTYGAFDWLSSEGTFNVFIIIGSVQAGICLLSIPMYIFGKRNRAFFGTHNILQYLGLW